MYVAAAPQIATVDSVAFWGVYSKWFSGLSCFYVYAKTFLKGVVEFRG